MKTRLIYVSPHCRLLSLSPKIIKMPVQVSPLLKLSRYAALFLGLAYGYKHKGTVAELAKHDREVEAVKAKEKAELDRLKKEADAAAPSIFD